MSLGKDSRQRAMVHAVEEEMNTEVEAETSRLETKGGMARFIATNCPEVPVATSFIDDR